jgi:hypothetical protein
MLYGKEKGTAVRKTIHMEYNSMIKDLDLYRLT